MLPRGVREKLLVIAQHIKKKHKQQEKEKAEGGSGMRNKMRQVNSGWQAEQKRWPGWIRSSVG